MSGDDHFIRPDNDADQPVELKIKHSMTLRPWQTPNFATVEMPPGRREDGPKPSPTIAVADLDAAALDALAFTWLMELYKKANRPCPFHS